MAMDNNASSWTSAQLVTQVRDKARLPVNDVTWTTARIMGECTDQIWQFAGWALQQSGNGARLTYSYDRSVAASLPSPYRAAGEFLLPPLAVADTLNNVVWVTADGIEKPLSLIDVRTQSDVTRPSDTGQPSSYAFLAGRIRVYPSPDQAGTVRFNYARRHPELVSDDSTNAPTVSSISDAGSGYTRFTLTASSPFVIGQYVDLVNNQYPYRTIFADLYVGANAGSTVDVYVPYTYVNVVSSAGMRLVRAGQLPYVQLPLELRSCLTWKIVASILVQTGDMQAAGAAEQLAGDGLNRFLGVATPQSKGDRQKIINRFSLARLVNRRGWRSDRM